MAKIILASASPYRSQLLQKLKIEFDIAAPQIDEARLPGESATQLVLRLAELKAKAIAAGQRDTLIIGSDQVATLGTEILGKPHTHDKAVQQLTRLSGQKVTFLTGLCLYNSTSAISQVNCVPYTVYFRRLNNAQIDSYLRQDQPYDCAGSFKSEGFGITLFDKLEGDDPNTLVGLPLIELVRMLKNEGIELP